jgi:hypothetical protein
MADNEKTRCYSYKVEMIVQVLAEDEKAARELLDKNGAYVSNRTVTLMDSVLLYTEATEEDI